MHQGSYQELEYRNGSGTTLVCGYREGVFGGDYGLVAESESLPYNNEEKNKEDTNMSFVGVQLTQYGILAFGDTKSTRISPLGNFKEEEGRNVQKVFVGEKYILTAYGTNQFSLQEKEIVKVYNLENYLAERIEGNSYLDMFSNLTETICSYKENLQFEYGFLVGGIDSLGVFLQHLSIRGGELHVAPKERGLRCRTGGNTFFQKAFYPVQYKSQEEDVNALSEELQSLMQNADRFGEYNPVGYPIDIVCMDLNGDVSSYRIEN